MGLIRVRSGNSSVVCNESDIPVWVRKYVSETEISDGTPFESGNENFAVSIEGPLESKNNWNSCWRFYSFSRLYDFLAGALTGIVNAESVGQLVSVNIAGTEYVLRITHVRRTDGKNSIDSITPAMHDNLNDQIVQFRSLLGSAKTGNIRLVHGVPVDYKPFEFKSVWHAFDVYVNACTDSCFENIFQNLHRSIRAEPLVVWAADFVSGDHLLRLIDLANSYPGSSVLILCHSLGNMDARIVAAVPARNIFALPPSESSLVQQADPVKETIEVPDVSRLPPSAVETANTYFVIPLTHPSIVAPFKAVVPHISAPKVLLYGPPQSGKSSLAKWMIAKVVEKTPSVTVIQVHASSLFSKYFGSSEKRVQNLFRKAASSSPCVVLIEGVHALCPARTDQDHGETGVGDTYNRMVATFLTCLDGLDTRDRCVSVIGTSLLGPDQLDAAAVRPGRLETHIHLPALASDL